MVQTRYHNGRLEMLIFCRYIKVKGGIRYPKNAKFFRFWVPVDKKAA